MENSKEYTVVISRQLQNSKTAEYDYRKIAGIHWTNQTGGYHTQYSFYFLCGYIPDDIAKDLVDCSGLHERYGNGVKICIFERYNKDEHTMAYRNLLESVKSPKPISSVSAKRPIGKPHVPKKSLLCSSNKAS